jgi:FdhD protein
MPASPAHAPRRIVRCEGEQRVTADDPVAVEEPLEIRVSGRAVAVVMRTPGHDRELAAGFLVTEGILRERDDLLDLVRCREVTQGEPPENIIDAVLRPGAAVDWGRLTRHVFTSSSCGICSKASIAAVRERVTPLAAGSVPSRRVIVTLPAALRATQGAFAATGGVHGCALFSADGRLEQAREDVGRHNALDKVIGRAFLDGGLPLRDRILMVSGRVSFEIVQKALAAGIGCVAAVSAPTSAAVDLAAEAGMVLAGFVRGERLNVYAGTLAE